MAIKTTRQLTREEAADLYDKTLLAMHPDEVIAVRMSEIQKEDAEASDAR